MARLTNGGYISDSLKVCSLAITTVKALLVGMKYYGVAPNKAARCLDRTSTLRRELAQNQLPALREKISTLENQRLKVDDTLYAHKRRLLILE